MTTFAEALQAGGHVHLPPGDYWVHGEIKTQMSGVTVTGGPGVRVISETTAQLLRLQDSGDVTFNGITFEVTGEGPGGYGLIYSLGAPLRNIQFNGCEFIAPGRDVNGVKFVADTAANEHAVDGVHLDRCRFNVGRMGAEIQDHTHAPTFRRVRDVSVTHSVFDHCGSLSTGIDLSFSGPILGAESRGNTFRGSTTIGAEFAGQHHAPVATDNTFINLGPQARPLSFTNQQNTENTLYPVIERNRSLGRSGYGPFFWNLADARMSHNVFEINGAVVFRDCARTVSTGDVYDSAGAYALMVESSNPARSCTGNTWRDPKLNTTASRTPFSVARFLGDKCHGNKVENGAFSKSGGVWSDQLRGAHNNTVVAPRHA